MFKSNKYIIFLIVLLSFMSINKAHADRRSFVWTYESKTMPKGEVELEYYFTTFANKDSGDTDYTLDFNHDIELEYGITDNFDIAIYQLFRHQEGGELSYRGYKVRGRYKIGVTGEYFVDPLIYLEIIHKPLSHEIEFEEKLVFSKNIGKWILALNLTSEEEIKYRDNVEEYKLIPTFAVAYQPKPWFSLGLEMMSHTEITSNNGYEHTAFLIGPTISLAGKSLWWNLGMLLQATQVYDEHSRFQIRSLMGLHF